MRDRIVLVIVTVGAIDGEAEERLADMFDVVFLPGVVVPAKEIADEKTCGDEVGVVRRRELVRREHHPHHLVVWSIVVQ